jgi:ABC-type antimicrobial peptide transport system permease subunit
MKDTKVDINKWSQSLMQKWIEFFEKDTIQTTIKSKMLDPILNHILKKIFPYIILICVMFALLLLAVLITLGVIVFQMRSGNIDIKIPSKVV